MTRHTPSVAEGSGGSSRLPPWIGPAAVLLSAGCFGMMAVLAKLAYGSGVSLAALLLLRFAIAGSVLLAIAFSTGRLRRLSRKSVVAGLLMGAAGYTSQAAFYFAALTRIDASLVAIVFCTYPLLVMAAAVALGRERLSRRVGALMLAMAGVTLALSGAASGSLDVVGASLAFASAVAYTAYILVGDRVATSDPVAFAALVCVGAFAAFTAWSIVTGWPSMAFDSTAWLWIVLIALVSTVAAIILFFFGLGRVGPTSASLLSTTEPIVTLTAAALVFGDVLAPPQLVGAAMVIGTVVLIQLPARRSSSGSDAPHAALPGA